MAKDKDITPSEESASIEEILALLAEDQPIPGISYLPGLSLFTRKPEDELSRLQQEANNALDQGDFERFQDIQVQCEALGQEIAARNTHEHHAVPDLEHLEQMMDSIEPAPASDENLAESSHFASASSPSAAIHPSLPHAQADYPSGLMGELLKKLDRWELSAHHQSDDRISWREFLRQMMEDMPPLPRNHARGKRPLTPEGLRQRILSLPALEEEYEIERLGAIRRNAHSSTDFIAFLESGNLLHFAVGHHQPILADYLLSQGTNPNKKDHEGNTPLHLAAFSNNVEMITLLIKKGADVDSWNCLGDTPLHIAALRRNASAAEALLAHEADPGFPNNAWKIPLHLALECPAGSEDNAGIIATLIPRMNIGQFSQVEGSLNLTVLHAAIYFQNAWATKEILKRLERIAESNEEVTDILNYKDGHKNTALHLAAAAGNHEITTQLLDCFRRNTTTDERYRKLIQTRDFMGEPPSFTAMRHGHASLANMLFAEEKPNAQAPWLAFNEITEIGSEEEAPTEIGSASPGQEEFCDDGLASEAEADYPESTDEYQDIGEILALRSQHNLAPFSSVAGELRRGLTETHPSPVIEEATTEHPAKRAREK